MRYPTEKTYIDLLGEVERLILDDQPHLAGKDDTLTALRHFDAFHSGPPQSYLGYRYRLRLALSGPRDRPLTAAETLRFISMTVDDGRTLRRYLSKKYGPLEAPGFDGGVPYTEEGSQLLGKLRVSSRIFDTSEAEESTLDHLENMTALMLAGEPAKAFEIHDEIVALILETLNTAGAPTERVTATHELLNPLMMDRAHNLTGAVEKVRAQFAGLRDGRYDFLLPYEDSLAQTVFELEQERIDFEVLPPGTDLDAHVRREHRRTAPNSASRIAAEKLRVLEDLRDYFGHERCQVLRGLPSSRRLPGHSEININGSYLVLVIACVDRNGRHEGDDAIAISPLAGQATFYVRHEAASFPWKEVFSYPKRDARAMGARRLHLTGPAGWDAAIALRERLIALAQCSPHQFRVGTPVPVPVPGTRKYCVT